jgi:hypothetical protein
MIVFANNIVKVLSLFNTNAIPFLNSQRQIVDPVSRFTSYAKMEGAYQTLFGPFLGKQYDDVFVSQTSIVDLYLTLPV